MPSVRHRFFVQDADAPGTIVRLPADEALHATRVLRLRPGASIRVFDGRGREFDGVVLAADKHVDVRIDAEAAAVPEPAVAVTLAHAVLKGDKMDGVVRDAVMMGAAAIRPIVTRHSEASLAGLARGQRVERWRRVALASAKQCGRAIVPEVLDPREFEGDPTWLTSAPEPRLVLVEPAAGGKRGATPSTVPRPAGNAATLLVGPEGGWAPEELETLAGSCAALTLGPRTLRADAAATVALAALFAVWRVDE